MCVCVDLLEVSHQRVIVRRPRARGVLLSGLLPGPPNLGVFGLCLEVLGHHFGIMRYVNQTNLALRDLVRPSKGVQEPEAK